MRTQILFQNIYHGDPDPLVPCVPYNANDILFRRLAVRFNDNGHYNVWDVFNRQKVMNCKKIGSIWCEHPGTDCINLSVPPPTDTVHLTMVHAERDDSNPPDLRFNPLPLGDNHDPNLDNLNLNLREDNLNHNLREDELDPNLEPNLDLNLREDALDPNLDPNMREDDLDPNLREENLPIASNQLRLESKDEKVYKNISMVELGHLCMTNFKSLGDIKMDWMGIQPKDLLLLFEMYLKQLVPSKSVGKKTINYNDPPNNWLMVVGIFLE